MAKKNKKIRSGKIKVISTEELEGAKIFENTPEYININGWVYEKHSKIEDGVNLALEFDEDTLNLLDEHMANNPGYINKQELIREALRHAIKHNTIK